MAEHVELNAQKLFDFARMLEQGEITSVRPDHRRAIALLVEEKSSRDSPKLSAVWRWDNDYLDCVFSMKTAKEFHHVNWMAHDSWLLVESRPKWTKRPKNGSLYSNDGLLKNEIQLGDAIASVQVTSAGEIWTSYFDEGVFGDDEASRYGLNCWSANGECLWKFTSGLESIDDCYALNVTSDNDTWICYYSDFPLVHILNRQVVRHWQSVVRGAHAFAIWQNRYALFGPGYDESYLTLVELRKDPKPIVLRTFTVHDGEGTVLKPFEGRQEMLYFRNNTSLYRISVEDALNNCVYKS